MATLDLDQTAIDALFGDNGPVDVYNGQLAEGIADNASLAQAPRSGREHKDGSPPLADTIVAVKVGPASWQVVAQSEHALMVHEGTPAHPIDIVNAKILMDPETGDVFGVHVDHPGTQGNPFLVRAMQYVVGT